MTAAKKCTLIDRVLNCRVHIIFLLQFRKVPKSLILIVYVFLTRLLQRSDNDMQLLKNLKQRPVDLNITDSKLIVVVCLVLLASGMLC